MRRIRRNHTPAFKAKVALAAIRDDQTIPEIAKRFDAHPNSIAHWKAQLLECADAVFEGGEPTKNDDVPDVKDLHAKIGQLPLENVSWAHALGRIDGPSAKR